MTGTIIDGIYYENGEPKHAGVVKVDGAIYYAGSGGVLAVGEKVVHSEMCNDLLKHGTYRFAEDGKLIKGSYIAPKKRKKKKEKKTRSAKNKKKRIALICAAAALLLFIGADLWFGWTAPKPAAPTAASDTGDSTLRGSIRLPSFDEPVWLCTESMQRYYRGELTLQQAIKEKQGGYAPFVFQYELPENVSAVLHLDGKEYSLDPAAKSLSIDNLMTGKLYEYSVSVTEIADETTRTTDCRGSFTTAESNRFISLPGVKNTRDIGGYRTLDGKRVRQGMIIRGTEIDGRVENTNYLTDKEAAKDFGFRTDLDLRSAQLYGIAYKSPLGDDTAHHFFDAPAYGDIFAEESKPILRDIFAELAEPDNYPMYMHCSYGADRSGTIIFLLQGVLGVSEEDMTLEFGLTGLYLSEFGTGVQLNGIYGGLDSIPGDTINEKICRFLLEEVGVPQAQLDSIRSILLE